MALAEGTQHCKNLQTLDLQWNCIDDDAMAIAEGLLLIHTHGCVISGRGVGRRKERGAG